MVDPGENVSQTVMREFMEEALDSTSKGLDKKTEDEVKAFFAHGKPIYKGYVDDPRNTDNAWMETVAFLFYDEKGNDVGRYCAGFLTFPF